MPDFGVNLSRFERKIKKNSKKRNKNLNDLKLIFLELAHLGLYSGKVWENRFFLYCMTLVDPYSKLLLSPADDELLFDWRFKDPTRYEKHFMTETVVVTDS